DRDGVGLGLAGNSGGGGVKYAVAGLPARGADRDGSIGVLSEPELELPEHLVLEHEIASVVRSRYGDREADAGTGSNVAGEAKTLVRIPDILASAAARVGEVNPKHDGRAALGGPDEASGIGNRDGVGLG